MRLRTKRVRVIYYYNMVRNAVIIEGSSKANCMKKFKDCFSHDYISEIQIIQ